MTKLLRKLWCVLVHRRVAAFARWTLIDGAFKRHCARCEYGWSWPATTPLIGRRQGYSGPVEVTYGRNGRERVRQLRAADR